ncbi:electron transfer flavoprotein-ubiquinone oxidoreductase [Vibrio parahaemolyticus]|uniref:electron transfer flavoprotein-ubiquinone oxidoreductase n=1 Tax=Vibrio parahaemolyticus TaxID=670 RepID=UPI0006C4DBA0|nr:electron transfer flavoprotein-ubiquinone oxidoreductase [Vibrio parahaemolyticus]EHR1199247.1 electron transfer flavoprotein-ubiquinone oxidoreductase [Vibrio parahaemolyticus]EHR5851819.1 electron transfer flavoprotein-ubiquinone oxidoreductase [Vibrio parahaemolyticus]EJG1882206.1 electron transfer flavoprotein-ubiquinone oxidoreductase [Vibrio parahaemolyticus]KOY35980.1 electron transfer flavoprotein-ubiquinone oxidoreductase [Vibrio parahaemolyticus]
MERDCMEFDVLIVGAGSAGLSAACRIKQLAMEKDQEISVCVVEKGSEVGAHILSGAVFETRSLDELFPDWKEKDAPLNTKVNQDKTYYLSNELNGHELPTWAVPNTLHNDGNYIISLGSLCRWMATQAENLGVEIYPGFSASEAMFDDQDRVCGVLTGDMGLDKNGEQKTNFEPGIELRAKFTLFAEGARGHIGKQLINKFNLAEDKTPQHYAIGFKELWEIPAEQHQQGLVVHGLGWPLANEASGGSYLYHLEGNQVAVGLIVDLNYENPHLSPFDEFQRFKHHPMIEQYLKNGKRISYGARAIAKGGFHSLPTQQFSGGLLIGCDAGTLNSAKIKGTHTAMKSGMLAAEAVFEAVLNQSVIADYQSHFKQSWLYEELYQARNFSSGIHRFGSWLGGGLAMLEHNVLKGKAKWNVRCEHPDHQSLILAENSDEILYPKPDGVLSFDRLSSVYLSNIFHEEDQPCHLQLASQRIPIEQNLALYAEPAQRYCPAGVYEIVEGAEQAELQINAANCIHCKTCDIKDPSQNITWTPPEGGGGPNYPNM